MLSRNDHLFFLAPTAYPLGGIAVWLDYLMNGLQLDSNAKITFGAVSGEYHDADQYLAKYPFARTRLIDCGTGSAHSRANAILDAIVEVRPTILVCTNVADAYAAARLLKQSHTIDFVLVATIHGLETSLFADMIEYSDVIDHIVVTNKLTRVMLLEMTQYSEKYIHYAPYGVVIPAPRISNNRSEPLTVLYCGRIAKDQKRCQDLIEIVDFWDQTGFNYKLLIVGDGPYKNQLSSELTGERIRFLGSIPAEQVYEKAYTRADVLLLTSEWETGPIVIWEALASGLAVVTSKFSGIKTEGALADKVNCLMFDVGATQDAADAVRSLSNISLRQRLIKNGRDLVASQYSRRESIDQWSATFSKISSLSRTTKRKPLRPVEFPKRGRLERLVGVRLADAIRIFLNRKVLINSAGDEWPHALTEFKPEFQRLFASRLLEVERANDKR